VTLRVRALEARLRRLKEVTRRLRVYLSRGTDRLTADEDLAWLVERGLQLGCEIVLDVANHVLAGGFGRSVETYEQVLDALAAEAVLSPQLRADLRGLGGFRNVLVHDYLALDPARVATALERAPEQFDRFAGEVHAWLGTRTAG
jgi:uncharacterized protein YutE (UPF0331/DUF86 family)